MRTIVYLLITTIGLMSCESSLSGGDDEMKCVTCYTVEINNYDALRELYCLGNEEAYPWDYVETSRVYRSANCVGDTSETGTILSDTRRRVCDNIFANYYTTIKCEFD